MRVALVTVAYNHCDPEDQVPRSPLYAYRLRAEVEALGLSDEVRFTPRFRMRSLGLPAEDMEMFYATADVHPLCSWGEGFGLLPIQAANAGLVPIAHGGGDGG
jgi:glycosyltransferase involved in cell wall biosynthesis